MQFTRMVCGRPVQVTQRFSCSSVSVCLPQWVVVARVCVRSSHVHLFLFCKTCIDSMAEVCPRLSGRPPHTHLREFQVARIPRSGHLPPISRTLADRTPMGEPGAAASPRPSMCGEVSTASQAPPMCDLPPLCFRSEVMVFQHEAADGVSTYPYLSTRFRGVPVREMLGRSATRVPPCKKEEAVYYGWREPSMHCVFQVSRRSERPQMLQHMPPARRAMLRPSALPFVWHPWPSNLLAKQPSQAPASAEPWEEHLPRTCCSPTASTNDIPLTPSLWWRSRTGGCMRKTCWARRRSSRRPSRRMSAMQWKRSPFEWPPGDHRGPRSGQQVRAVLPRPYCLLRRSVRAVRWTAGRQSPAACTPVVPQEAAMQDRWLSLIHI